MSSILYKDYKIDANFYDIFNKDRNYNVEMRFLLKMLKNRRRVLDVGCGTGTHMSILENLGYIVCGIDISPKMIAVAKTKVNNVEKGNLLNFKQEEKYNAIICMNHVFNHLNSYEEFEEGLNNLLLHLEKNGLIILDLDNRRQTGTISDKIDGNKRIIECLYNRDTEIQVRKITTYIGARKFVTEHRYLIYDPRKLEDILRKYDIKYAMVTNFCKQKFNINDKYLHIVIRKV